MHLIKKGIELKFNNNNNNDIVHLTVTTFSLIIRWICH